MIEKHYTRDVTLVLNGSMQLINWKKGENEIEKKRYFNATLVLNDLEIRTRVRNIVTVDRQVEHTVKVVRNRRMSNKNRNEN